jgi:hypothetical protein
VDFWTAEQCGDVSVATFSNPPHNQLSKPMIDELDQLVVQRAGAWDFNKRLLDVFSSVCLNKSEWKLRERTSVARPVCGHGGGCWKLRWT